MSKTVIYYVPETWKKRKRRKSILTKGEWRALMSFARHRYDEAWETSEAERVRLAQQLEGNPSLKDLIDITRRSQYWITYWLQYGDDDMQREAKDILERSRVLNEKLMETANRLIERDRGVVPIHGRK